MLSLLKQLLNPRRSLDVTQRSTDLAAQWLRADDDPPQLTLTNAFSQSTWVYACVSAIAQQVAHTPFRISIDEDSAKAHWRGETLLHSGQLVELFSHPHPQLDRFLFWELLVSWLLLRGQAFVVGLDPQGNVLAINPARTLPAQLMVLNPDRLTRVVADHQLLGYRFQAGHHDLVASRELLPEEVISLRLANPFNPCDGHSPATVASLAAQTDYAAAQFMKALMLSNADIGLLVTVPNEPSAEQRAQLLAALRERRRKAPTTDRPLLLWSGAKIEKPALSMVDIQFLDNRKFSRQEICAIYKTPQEILGFTEDANRAVADAARLSWIENTIAPLCERLAAAFAPLMNFQGALKAEHVHGWFDIESLPIMQNARRERFRAARQGFEMGVPIAVLNQLFDLGLPALPHDDVSFLPATFQPHRGLNGTSYASPDPTRMNDTTPALPHAGVVIASHALQQQTETRVAVPSTLGPTAVPLDHSTAALPQRVSALRSKLCRFFFEQRGRVLAGFMAGSSTPLDLPAENERLRSALRPILQDAVAAEHIPDINETTLQHLSEATASSGPSETQSAQADRIRRVFQSAARERAPMLARLLATHRQPQPVKKPTSVYANSN